MKIMIPGAMVPAGLLVLSSGYALSINSSIFGEVNDRFHRFTHDTSVFGESADAVSVRNTAATASFDLHPGMLRGQPRATGDPGPNGSTTGLAWATAFAGYAESITLDAPGLSGLTGQISADVWINYHFPGAGPEAGLGRRPWKFLLSWAKTSGAFSIQLLDTNPSKSMAISFQIHPAR